MDAPLRGFAFVQAYADKGLTLPHRKTTHSAGYDIASAETIAIAPGEIKLVPTGVKAYMKDDEVLLLYARSSIAVAKQLILMNGVGVIDSDYYDNESNEGHVLLPLYNAGKATVTILEGERVAQGVFAKYLSADHEEPTTSKRKGGFGSTGR
jgi:dUTP pyrophosphatase